MSVVKEYECTELLDFSSSLQYYYGCRLEKDLIWKCAKFKTLKDAEIFISKNQSSTHLSKIIPTKCANTFEVFENKILSNKINFPINIIK